MAAGASLALALWAAIQSGRTHPDEVYQFLEPANHLAFHYGYLSWEWSSGLRNWAMPGALAGGMALLHALGWTSVMGHRIGAALVVAVLGYPGFRSMLTYARRRTESLQGAALAVGLVLTWALSIYFLGRTMGEPIGALFAVAGIATLEGESFGAWMLAGIWLGAAVVVRYNFGLLALAAVIQELLRRRWKPALGAVAGGLIVAAALGALDWATWGHPFESMLKYLTFNLGSGVANKFGSEPWTYFFPVILKWTPWPLLVGFRRLELRRDRFLLPAALYLAALIATPHKEERFYFPVVLWVAMGLAPAAAEWFLDRWRTAGSRWVAGLAAAAWVGASALVYSNLPDLETDLFKATMEIGKDPLMTGLIIVNESKWGCGATSIWAAT